MYYRRSGIRGGYFASHPNIRYAFRYKVGILSFPLEMPDIMLQYPFMFIMVGSPPLRPRRF
jgi:hypothetical protein